MKEYLVNSVNEFIDQIKVLDIKGKISGDRFWFRAENEKHADTFLRPNLFRNYFENSIFPNRHFTIIEETYRTLFLSEAYPIINKNYGRLNKLAEQFLMQHYGMHTRLLDWSDNALISLFFASEDIYANHDAVVWVLNPFTLNYYTRLHQEDITQSPRFILPTIEENENIERYFDLKILYEKNRHVELPIAIKPFYLDDRMKNQSSNFTFFGWNSNGLLSHPYNEEFLVKVTIPKSKLREIKRDLYELGISYDTIYPGLEGISKKLVYASEEYYI